MIYRMVAGFVGLHMLEDIGLLSMGYFLGAHLPAWIFFPLGILVSTVLFTLFARKVMKT